MDDQPTNDELVRRATAGDIPAFGTLYDRTVRLVRAVAADAGPDAAEDVTHDTFLRAFQKLKTLREPTRFAPWLIGIARIVVLERRRARRFDAIPDQMPAQSDMNAEALDDAQELLRLVAQLPQEERLAIRFFFLSERSIDETARLLNRSRSGTYAILQRAKARLARWLLQCGVTR